MLGGFRAAADVVVLVAVGRDTAPVPVVGRLLPNDGLVRATAALDVVPEGPPDGGAVAVVMGLAAGVAPVFLLGGGGGARR